MIGPKHLASLALLSLAGIACTAAAVDQPRPASSRVAAIDPYRTALFNLLLNQKNAVDNKNYYQVAFARQFDALLASSNLAKADRTGISLKKRLLSGPAAEGSVMTDLATGRQFIYFDACQAHRCDETALDLLFDPVSRRMVARLTLNGQVEYLGAPVESEKRLIERKQAGG